MSNKTRFQRKQYRSKEGRRAPSHYTASQLHEFLVADAVQGIATDLKWAMGAYQEIAKQRRQELDVAYRAVEDQVKAFGREMPLI